MKVPHRYTQRTQPSGQQLGYLSGSGPQTGVLGGLGQGLSALGIAADQWNERQDKTQRMQTLSGLTDFQTNVTERLTEMKRNQELSVTNFPEQAAAQFDNLQAEFLNTVPANLQEEFKYRTDLLKQNVVTDSLEFQYTSQDAFYDQEISKSVSNAQLSLSQSQEPLKDLEKWQAGIAETIMAADIPENEKAARAREANIALQAVVYKQQLVNQGVERATLPDNASAHSLAAPLLKEFEGFREEPYWDVNADRIGYGSDTVTLADGTVKKVTKGMRVSRADADRDLQRRIGEFEQTIVGQVGVDAYSQLPANVRAPLISVAYNYGSLPNSVERAVESGDIGEIADAVGGLSANKDRRLKEAAIIRGDESVPMENLDADPRFASLPFEDRVALQEDAQKSINSLLTDMNEQQKAAYDLQLNEMMNGIQDGNVGRYDIAQAYNGGAGWLTDYTDRMKAINAWEERNEEVITLAKAQEKLASNNPWDPNSTDDKKFQNVIFNQRGPAAFAEHDMQYSQMLAGMAARTHDIPTDAAGMLTGMSRSTNPERAMYALNTMAMLQEQAPDAFDQRFTEEDARKVRYWQERQDSVPQEELLQKLRGGTTQAERQSRTMLREEAQDVLREKSDGVPRLNELVGQFVSEYDPYGPTGAPETYGVPWAARGLYRDFATAFTDNYELYGNAEEASEAAIEQLKKEYAVTEIGGQRTLMKYPPERSGYRPVDIGTGNDYAYIEREVRETFELEDDQVFQLISDEQTDSERDYWKRVPDAEPPSYVVSVKTDHGWEVKTRTQNGKIVPYRMAFEPSAEDLEKEQALFRQQELQQKLTEVDEELQRALSVRQGSSGGMGPLFPVDDGIVERLQTRKRNLETELRTTAPGPTAREARERMATQPQGPAGRAR